MKSLALYDIRGAFRHSDVPPSPRLSPRGRFWRWVAIDDPDRCWRWLGRYNEKGYGTCEFPGFPRRAHRAMWQITQGRPVPRGKFICHTCDWPSCVNPRHLYVGTAADNWRDAFLRGRTRVGRKGAGNIRAKVTEAQVLEIRRLYDALPRDVKGFHVGVQDIAPKYGLTRAQISHIGCRRSWKHLPPAENP